MIVVAHHTMCAYVRSGWYYNSFQYYSTNPNPEVRKSGAVVGKAVLASMVLEEGSIRAARGDSRERWFYLRQRNSICTWLVNGPGGFRIFEEQKKPSRRPVSLTTARGEPPRWFGYWHHGHGVEAVRLSPHEEHELGGMAMVPAVARPSLG